MHPFQLLNVGFRLLIFSISMYGLELYTESPMVEIWAQTLRMAALFVYLYFAIDTYKGRW